MAWAFIAHKDGYWAGVCAADIGKRDLKKFVGDFAAEGFSISAVNNREEYNALLATLKFWHDSPEWKMKHQPAANDAAA